MQWGGREVALPGGAITKRGAQGEQPGVMGVGGDSCRGGAAELEVLVQYSQE